MTGKWRRRRIILGMSKRIPSIKYWTTRVHGVVPKGSVRSEVMELSRARGHRGRSAGSHEGTRKGRGSRVCNSVS